MQETRPALVTAGRRYREPVDVRRRDDAPAEFLWRGRLYLVRAVLAAWAEVGRWWDADLAGVPADGERQVWRVEAGAGARAGTGVYDLCFDWASGAWSVARVLD